MKNLYESIFGGKKSIANDIDMWKGFDKSLENTRWENGWIEWSWAPDDDAKINILNEIYDRDKYLYIMILYSTIPTPGIVFSIRSTNEVGKIYITKCPKYDTIADRKKIDKLIYDVGMRFKKYPDMLKGKNAVEIPLSQFEKLYKL